MKGAYRVLLILAIITACLFIFGHSSKDGRLQNCRWDLTNPEVTGHADYHSTLTFHGDSAVANEFYFRDKYSRFINGTYHFEGNILKIRIGKINYKFRYETRQDTLWLINNRGQALIYKVKQEEEPPEWQ
jgi:hypothetical protein